MARGWKYWKCKLNLSHNWGQVSTEDGGHYVACLDCAPPAVSSRSTTPGALGLGASTESTSRWPR
jgi:hypothetical protein